MILFLLDSNYPTLYLSWDWREMVGEMATYESIWIYVHFSHEKGELDIFGWLNDLLSW